MAQQRSRAAKRLARRYGLKAKGGVALACVLLILVLGGFGVFGAMHTTSFRINTQDRSAESAANEEVTAGVDKPAADVAKVEEPTVSTVVVHVDGAVTAPGVYVLEGASLRVNDAIQMAQGLLPDADTTSMNLAAPIEDGQKIHVPREGEAVQEQPTVAAAQQQELASSTSETASGRVNLNTATVDELQKLPGVGEATASAIVEDRQSNGPFSSPEDIMRVSGIGEKKFQKMQDMIDV